MSEMVVVYLINLVAMLTYALAIRSVNKGEKGACAVIGCTLFAAIFAVGHTGLNYPVLLEVAPIILTVLGAIAGQVADVAVAAGSSIKEMFMGLVM